MLLFFRFAAEEKATLYQRGMAQIGSGLQDADQLFKGKLLMGKRLPGRLLYTL